MMLHEYTSRSVALLLKTTAFGLFCGVVVCCLDEGDNKILDSGEELYNNVSLVPVPDYEAKYSYIVYFTRSVEILILSHFWPRRK